MIGVGQADPYHEILSSNDTRPLRQVLWLNLKNYVHSPITPPIEGEKL